MNLASGKIHSAAHLKNFWMPARAQRGQGAARRFFRMNCARSQLQQVAFNPLKKAPSLKLKLTKRSPLWLVALAAAISFSASCLAPREPSQARVVNVVDGDTVDLDSGTTVRYIGIDTPETKRKISGQWVPAEDPFGEEAKRANESLVLGKKVRLEYDVQKKDKYNRTLAYVFVEGLGGREIFVEAELLRRGLAFIYTLPPNVKYTDVLVEAQKAAKEARAGMWGADLEIKSSDAQNFLGQRKFVTGKVKRVRRTQKTNILQMEGLNVVIFANDLEFFRKEGIVPEAAYQDKTMNVFGLIKSYRGEPEIIVSHPCQIEVLD